MEEGAADEAEAPPAPPGRREAPAAAAPAERTTFSLFSWLRRDGEDKKPS